MMVKPSASRSYGANQLVRGVQAFRNRSTGRYIVTDDPNFKPNWHINGNWGELQLVPPQP